MKGTFVKREIQMLREVVVKLTQLLAGQGLTVTQRGTQAYVVTDPKTLKPTAVNIPNIPDDASDDLVLAIQGFIDHEIGHVLFTTWSIIASIADKPKLKALHNIVEDTFVERSIGKKFPGSVYNLDRLHSFFLERITQPALDKVKGNPEEEFRVLLVPLARAWAGQKRFQDFLKDFEDHPYLSKFIKAVPPDVIAKFPNISNSTEALEVALVLEEILTPPPPPPVEAPPKAKPEKPCTGGPSGDMSAPMEDEGGSSREIAEGDTGGRSDKSASSAPTGESTDEDAGEDDKADDDDETEDGDEDDDAGGEDDAAEDAESDAPAEESESETTSPDGPGESVSADGPAPEGLASPFDKPIEVDESDTFEGKISEKIGHEAVGAMSVSSYRIYSRDFDKIEPLAVEESHYRDAWLTKLDDKVAHMVGPMQKDIERMMAARSQVLKVPGFRSGRLHGAGLHRLNTGDDRIFRRRHEVKAIETAVTLLIDNSGSMNGSGKIGVAMAAAYALSSTLDRVRVSHEVLGFTTHEPRDFRDEMAKIHDEEKMIGRKFTRTEPLWMPIFKQFHERMTPTIKKRFAAAEHQISLCQNVDGECIEIAAMRLLRRTERRKVLIVLSDGAPACCSPDPSMITRHTGEAVRKAESMGVETIGIGILDDSVRHFYPKHVVLRNLKDLPGAVMAQLRQVLLRP